MKMTIRIKKILILFTNLLLPIKYLGKDKLITTQLNWRKSMKKILLSSVVAALISVSASAVETYGPYPVTVKGYEGKKENSVAYTGQIARHTLEKSLKKLASKGDGKPNPELKAKMMAYYAGKDAGRAIIDPTTKGEFKIKQTKVDDISKGKNLKGKTYKGLVNGFPGQMTGPEMVEFLIDKASSTKGGYDPVTGYKYDQLISKFLMGAVFYNQAVDNYLDEKLEANTKPNNKAYKDGKHYTGKEHVWDEAFGYFGIPAHGLALDGEGAYGIAKKKNFKGADYNKDGVVDLKSEMTFGPAYYAADSDKTGTSYMHTITQAFVDGRKLITAAKGEKLTDAQRNKLKEYASIIKVNWEKVLAEATFKYAGSVYKDLVVIKSILDGGNGDIKKAFKKYSKHWGEMKGFMMALQTSGKDLGETAVKLNRLSGFGPVLVTGGQVTGIDKDGNYEIGGDMTIENYMVHMVKVQKVLDDKFELKAKKNDMTKKLKALIKEMGKAGHVEND